ncbi:mannose-1-phosphate guanyltransferase [Vairimorpha necatrix]|uniref:mannose-1-phosphate guanylyltransferase n=1 Tax=Vairimorpha necatrix TaxID=6039 RepID=A0AAX4J8K3_9MICR
MVHLKNQPRALILVGGYGTRLRPLTYTLPKPLVPFINKPILEHQISALVKIGVKVIILALNYYSDLIIEKVKVYETKYNIQIIYSKEDEVLGTAGPLALARRHLKGVFYVLNSDVICDYPLYEMMIYHLSTNYEATMLTTSVEDPSRYGVVITHENTHTVKSFIEKPKALKISRINAGIYIFNESILNRIELKESSLERDIFPNIVKDNLLGTFDLRGFWMDIGQIKDYLIGQHMYLKRYLVKEHDIEKNVVIGDNVKIGQNVYIENSTIFDNVLIGNNVIIKDSIIGWNSIIKSGAKINGSVLGDSVNVSEDCILDSLLIKPDKIVEL